MDVVDAAWELIAAGLDDEGSGLAMQAAERYRAAIELLAADRMEHGPRLPHVVDEAKATGMLLRVLDDLGDDEAGLVLVAALDLWEVAVDLDPAGVEDLRYVQALDGLGRRAMGMGDVVVARRAHGRAARVADQFRGPGLLEDSDDPDEVSVVSTILGVDSLDADLLTREGRLAEAAAVLRASIDLVDQLGHFPSSTDGATQPLMAEANLVGRFLGRASATGWDRSELEVMHDRYLDLLERGYAAARDEDQEMYAAMAVNLTLNGIRLAPICGRADRIGEYADRVRTWLHEWAATDSVIAQVLAGDIEAALATFEGAGPRAGADAGDATDAA